jgi:pimeloyl-ACP methyl ester carboxylesterase
VPILRSILSLIVVALSLAGADGYCSCATWSEPPPPRVSDRHEISEAHVLATVNCDHGGHRTRVDALLAQFAASRDPRLAYDLSEYFTRLAVKAEQSEHPSCAGWYYLASAYSWIALNEGTANPSLWNRACDVYHKSVARLITVAQHDCTYIPGHGFNVDTAYGPVHIQLVANGFVWQLGDFQQLYPVGEYETSTVSRQYRRAGFGVPLVVRRVQPTGAFAEEAFIAKDVSFAATAVLTPVDIPTSGGMCLVPTSATLSLYNPLNPPGVEGGDGQSRMATDITAPFAFGSIIRRESDFWLTSFINPNDAADDGLLMLEPYQPGKIPVIFVHGLLSSPATWIDLANDLRAQSEFARHFQIWAYRYATGGPFLDAAARLRRDMTQLIATVDPKRKDAALGEIVLLGHSMGGLVAKLQTVDSGGQLWAAVANQPLEQIVTNPAVRQKLSEHFFFKAHPDVRRVVYLATPHLGSRWSKRPIGRLGAALVRPRPDVLQQHRQLMDSNPGVFSPEMQDGMPTSIDMLDPDSRSLQTIRSLPNAPWVKLHSIVGTKHTPVLDEPGDSVVSINSARYPGAESELFVHAKHTHVHRDPHTVAEVWRILRQHLAEVNGNGS